MLYSRFELHSDVPHSAIIVRDFKDSSSRKPAPRFIGGFEELSSCTSNTIKISTHLLYVYTCLNGFNSSSPTRFYYWSGAFCQGQVPLINLRIMLHKASFAYSISAAGERTAIPTPNFPTSAAQYFHQISIHAFVPSLNRWAAFPPETVITMQGAASVPSTVPLLLVRLWQLIPTRLVLLLLVFLHLRSFGARCVSAKSKKVAGYTLQLLHWNQSKIK